MSKIPEFSTLGEDSPAPPPFDSARYYGVETVRPLSSNPLAPNRSSVDRMSPNPRRWFRPLVFYLLTWLSTTWVGQIYSGGGFIAGLWFSVPLMIILTCHELGHYVQARRYGVSSTLPFFIPVPFPPFGTFGAVIRMDSRIPSTTALFDIGISGPLAGLIPTLIFLVVGIALSQVVPLEPSMDGLIFGEPLLFRWIADGFFGPRPLGTDLAIHPIGMAAWTGLFITSLNLFPLSQLDGGHVFYALMKRKAAAAQSAIFFGLLLLVVLTRQNQWFLMLLIVMLIGVVHPPTADDRPPLGRFRTMLGWSTLAFLVVGFTPHPISEMPRVEPEPLPPIYARAVLSETVERDGR